MIFRKTTKSMKKRMFMGALDSEKKQVLCLAYTYWFLFIPVYTVYEV